jgi:hypothetical protein
MNTKPIIFSAPMINALLDGRKAQTRRVVKPQPADGKHLEGWVIDSTNAKDIGKACWGRGCGALSYDNERIRCPYGQPGDLLWVREACAEPTSLDPGPTFFRADYPACVPSHFENVPPIDRVRWKPSIHMRRDQSRLTLQITDVRVQRLQEISEADADAEVFGGDFPHAVLPHLFPDADAAGRMSIPECFRVLWESINGPESWDANPWVWSLSFRVIHANVDAVLAYPAAYGVEVRNAA